MQTADRTSKYIEAVRAHMHEVGHATNVDLLAVLRQHYPELSATTVHRITTRLLSRNELQMAPTGKENIMRFDVNLEPHDHFMCKRCGMLKDAHLDDSVRLLVEKAIGDDCSISGSLTVSGVCKQCKKEGV